MMKNNINPSKNPITTLIGVMFLLISIVMLIIPMFFEVKTDTPYWIPGTGIVLGLILLLIPDDLKGALRKVLTKKTDQI